MTADAETSTYEARHMAGLRRERHPVDPEPLPVTRGEPHEIACRDPPTRHRRALKHAGLGT